MYPNFIYCGLKALPTFWVHWGQSISCLNLGTWTHRVCRVVLNPNHHCFRLFVKGKRWGQAPTSPPRLPLLGGSGSAGKSESRGPCLVCTFCSHRCLSCSLPFLFHLVPASWRHFHLLFSFAVSSFQQAVWATSIGTVLLALNPRNTLKGPKPQKPTCGDHVRHDDRRSPRRT